MSTYIDPSTALALARQARDEHLRRAERHRQSRLVRDHGVPAGRPRRHRRWHLEWRRTLLAH
ncbi:hypothetical protein KRR39_09600 [Nocardioides panacis]|uniref:Uncharacterized protein n=1 Tax=Nocardioides panacis TaxID=2849501 RepID=A0A975Y1X0_9ACTN|nr:hypothetical protein [Nocardioides panacis]QWZ09951.1 hypothetical protein KRR39_09600 [Nocardioides panacis]